MSKIFIVEDEKTIRDELSIFLSRYGYQIEAPDNFENVIENIKESKADLILLDINLPIFDGYYICREVRKFSEMDERFKNRTYGIQPNTKIYTIGEKGLLPINAVKRFNPLNFSQNICDYTKAGRKKLHDELLEVSSNELGGLQHIRDTVETIEFNDNIISAYVVQIGMCYI